MHARLTFAPYFSVNCLENTSSMCVHMQGLKQRPPIVVAAHGIAGQKDMGLEPFAELFASKGMAVLLFDYRNFGGSEGEPATGYLPRGTFRTGMLLWTMSGYIPNFCQAA